MRADDGTRSRRWWGGAPTGCARKGYFGSPDRNPALEQALGVRTGVAPARLHVSPRAGFSWTYNRDRDNGNGSSNNSVGKFYRATSGVVRGGIGEFRDLLRPDILADAGASTGLPGGTKSSPAWEAAFPPLTGTPSSPRRMPYRPPAPMGAAHSPSARPVCG
jgi:hypothetical protein